MVSGAVLLGVNTLYQLALVPVALHYLSQEEFGLWAVVMQISGYLLLIDLGMAGSVARILVNYKDRPAEGGYGSVIKTAALVLAVQGAIIALVGFLLSFWMAGLFHVPTTYRREFQVLVAGQCGLTGALYVTRVFWYVLQAHQRYDVFNYSQMGGSILGLGTMWFGFARGWGVYSMLAAYAAGTVFVAGFSWLGVSRLNLFPPAGAWGRVQWSRFKELFSYGADLFLMSVGFQLISASQVLIIGHALGLKTAAVWSIETKSFVLAQQLVFYIWTFSSTAIYEMIVREERERLLRRFRHLVLLTASTSIFVGTAVAVCNSSFVEVWTKGRISWTVTNDWLLCLLLLVSTVSRCHIGLAGQPNQIRGMRYVYFLEGLCFAGLALLATPRFGMTAILVTAIVMNIVWSGAYGVRRTAETMKEPLWHVAFGWLAAPGKYLLLFIPLAALWAGLVQPQSSLARLALNAGFVGLAGLFLLWRVGLTPDLRSEVRRISHKFTDRLRQA